MASAISSSTEKSSGTASTAPTGPTGAVGATVTNDILMVSLSRFYSQRGNIARLLPFISSESNVSLRLIDWFVTNYAKSHNVVLTRRGNGNVVHFNVYLNYRAQLKAYSKQQFDPFRRRDRVMFFYDKNKSIETTVGQLNFFRWMLQNDIVDYIVANARDIENDMILAQKKSNEAATVPSAPLTGGRQDVPRDAAGTSAAAATSAASRSGGKKRIDASMCKATRNMTRFVGERVFSFE